MQYADEAMRRLSESLRATNVLSVDYRRDIEGWALQAVSQGYARGLKAGQEREREARRDPLPSGKRRAV